MTWKRCIRLTIAIIPMIFVWLLGKESGEDQQVPPDPGLGVKAIVDSLIQQHNQVEDYTVNIKISVEMPRFRMPRKRVKLYYKAPRSKGEASKMKVEADGFAVVPKTGLTMYPLEIFDNFMEIKLIGQDTLGHRPQWVVEGRLHGDSLKWNLWAQEGEESPQFSMKLWVDSESWVITRATTLLDTMTVMTFESSFKRFNGDIWLPEVTELRFFLSGKYLATIGDHNAIGPPMRRNDDFSILNDGEDFQGSVKMEFSRYKINQGLTDKDFKESILK